MADTDSLDRPDLDDIEFNLPAHYFECASWNVDHAGRQDRCDCIATKDVRALISYARSLESQLAASAVELKSRDDIAAALIAELRGLRSQLAESQRENERLRNQVNRHLGIHG